MKSNVFLNFVKCIDYHTSMSHNVPQLVQNTIYSIGISTPQLEGRGILYFIEPAPVSLLPRHQRPLQLLPRLVDFILHIFC